MPFLAYMYTPGYPANAPCFQRHSGELFRPATFGFRGCLPGSWCAVCITIVPCALASGAFFVYILKHREVACLPVYIQLVSNVCLQM